METSGDSKRPAALAPLRRRMVIALLASAATIGWVQPGWSQAPAAGASGNTSAAQPQTPGAPAGGPAHGTSVEGGEGASVAPAPSAPTESANREQTPNKPETPASDVAANQIEPLPTGAQVEVTDREMLDAARNRGDWILHGRTYDNDRYSPLHQVTAKNVSDLTPVALIQTGMAASFETTPIVVDGVMYVTTPIVNNKMKIMAFNATTGAPLWETVYNIKLQKLCCGPVNRGIAIGYGKVFIATSDAKLLALDAETGNEIWQTALADPRAGYSETMAPQIYDGLIIVGSSGGEWPIRGFVAAYRADDGQQVWRFNTTDPKTFAGDSWKTGGGMVWTTPAIDPKRGLVIFSVGNPNPDLNGASRQGDNLYTESIVALDVHTGKLAWYYQELKHDVWDYDAVSNVLLFDAKDQTGKMVPAAGEAGKVGNFFIVNRENGELIRKSVPFVMVNENMGKPPTKEGIDILPGANGGSEWSPPAYSPKTNDVYILGLNQLMKYTLSDVVTLPGAIRMGSTFKNVEKSPVQNGTFTAINVNTGKIDWQVKTPQPMMGGALATAGNLVFTGEGNGWFDAFNAKTGEKLWRYRLGAGVNAPPVTYEVLGRQYIAVAAGGNFQLDYPLGDLIAIFALPERHAER